ncbi:hypothetical protein Afer_1926 [Acidimicrobium ferrooxidans DSM 10331]|uniref:Glycosyltransferase RgtA/B/C/D-like domain-containing protein n=1 Tax=Acidimicrobium ferrooxidans (strain DSM 10331 / JCM 15462 / NBRC 103882 / ICP) TaxID=525909 RepID=C7M1T3_ACIFD|nr:DUF2079 domain-containing protein [Acidimicrobium ferrooxidans]ACU54830.1 hypothetical protein Afer_1926 [Acidimicrobium ferrooxidans DSM 10331]
MKAEERVPPSSLQKALAWILEPRQLLALNLIGSLAAFVLLGTYEYLRWRDFDLGIDYAIQNQGTFLIAHGHLAPRDTIYGGGFDNNALTYLFIVIGLVRTLVPTGVMLLVLQALAVAATYLFIMQIVIRVTRRLPLGWRGAVVIGSALLTFLNPWALEAVSFDVHGEPFGALGLVVLLYGMLRSQRTYFYAGLALALLSGAGTLIVLAGLSVGLLATKSTRRWGIRTTIGVVIIGIIALLTGDSGSSFSSLYGYLASSSGATPGATAILRSIVEHPTRPVSVLVSRWPEIRELIGYAGIIGLAWPPTLVAAVAAVVANGLPQNSAFLSLTQGFQNWPVEAVLVAGGAIVVSRLAGAHHANHDALSEGDRANGRSRWRLLGGRAIVALWTAVSVAIGIGALSTDLGIPRSWFNQPYASVSALRVAQRSIPRDAEVVATINAIARVSARAQLFQQIAPTQAQPVCAAVVDVLIEVPGPYAVLTSQEASHDVRTLLRAPGHTVLQQSGVVLVQFGGLHPGREALIVPTGQVVTGPQAASLDASQCQ